MPLLVMAQGSELNQVQRVLDDPEEVVITGKRLVLRTKMMETESSAYEIFNKFKDEIRFDMSCNMHQPTGTRIERQICQPKFILEATAGHTRDYWGKLPRAE